MTLTFIKGQHWLDTPAAVSWNRAVAAGMPPNITSAGRSSDTQIRLFLENYTTDYNTSSRTDKKVWKGNTYWRRKVTTKGKATVSVAVPGTSRHEGGKAVDVPEPTRAWLHKNGAKYGWINPPWAKKKATFEPWHFEYDEAKDTSKTNTNTNTNTKTNTNTTTPPKESDMPLTKEDAALVASTLLGTVVGKNPATDKDMTFREAALIACNYGYYGWQKAVAIQAALTQLSLEEGISQEAIDARVASALNGATVTLNVDTN